jgi:hypothetical protein
MAGLSGPVKIATLASSAMAATRQSSGDEAMPVIAAGSEARASGSFRLPGFHKANCP